MPDYNYIDMESYPRMAHFDYFRNMSNPYVGVTVNVDVTGLVSFCRGRGISFSLVFMHAVCLAANSVPQLRQRIKDGKIIEYAFCDTSHTESTEAGAYAYCTLRHNLPFEEYISAAAEAQEKCRKSKSLEEDEDVDSLLFLSAVPWLHYSQIIQPTSGGDETNPRITWGKFEENFKGRLMMPVTILCHHALVDGKQLGEFYEALGREIAKFDCEAQ